MRLRRTEDQGVDALPLLGIGSGTPMEGVAEMKFGAERKEWTIWRLPYPGIHHIISIQTLTPLHKPARFGWKDTDIAVSSEDMPGPGKNISGCSQSAIRWNIGPPMEDL